MIEWLFDSPQRLRNVMIGCAVGLVALMVVLLAAGGGGEDRPARGDGPTSTGAALQNPASPAASATLPASPDPTTAEYGSSGPIALEAVNAFLAGDRSRFAALAQPEVVESANEAPAPSGEVTGDVRTLLGGPTQQQVLVPTTKGDLVLIMLIMDKRWQVSSLEYAK